MDHPQREDEMTDRPTLTTGSGHRHSFLISSALQRD
ncbi:hypothetical protein R3I94_009841 [Phoxinus phoxinus]|uniref:Uncharacterized protein n=1 Tax=Phoxinus phoxinus TaxID=58324 RepID=A0AAN9H8D6_9TELE